MSNPIIILGFSQGTAQSEIETIMTEARKHHQLGIIKWTCIPDTPNVEIVCEGAMDFFWLGVGLCGVATPIYVKY